MKKSDLLNETAKNCWSGYRKTGTQPGTGKNKGEQVNDCEKIEEMMPKSSFAGTKKNKLGKAAHLTGKMKRPAKPGDLVGGAAEGIDLHLNEMHINKLHVKKLLSEEEVIDHVRLHTKNLALDNVPRTHRNIYPTICSTNFALSRTSLNESDHISAGRKLISMLHQLDQFPKLNIKLGSKVAIINYQLQGDWCELWGFTTPKTITKILRDNDDAITRFEFNNDSDDYWPRTEHAEYNGNFITNTAFFADKNSAEKAVSLTMLRFSDVLTIKNAINDNEDLSETAAWRRKEGKNKNGGLNAKGVASYRRENPGSKLQTAVTTKPSKLDPDSKAAKRRKSFCARMGGTKKNASVETRKDPDSPVNKALRRWNCESVEQLARLVMIAEQHIRKNKKLSEISDPTLTSYLNKARADKIAADKALDKIDGIEFTKEWDTIYDRMTKREDGVKRAEEKLYKVNTSFTKNLVTILRQRYPGVEFIEDPGMEVSSADGELKVVGYEEIEGNKIAVFIGDAATGKYTGAVKAAIATTLAALRKIHPRKKPTLIVDGDESNGVWQHIAKELKISYIDSGY